MKVTNMNCEKFQADIALLVYDELDDASRHELEMHIAQCGGCKKELEQARALKTVFAMDAVEEPSASMLAASRMRLQEALEQEQPRRSWTRFAVFDFAGWMHQMRFSPALSAVLLIAGFAGGSLTSYKLAASRTNGNGAPVFTAKDAGPTTEASIAGIRGIEQDPTDPNKVNIKFDRLMPAQAQGSVNDPAIQKLLLFAAQSQRNTGVKLDSINLLTQSPEDATVREALVYALRYDKNPGVRLKALDGLKDYVASDTRVRDAVLDALMKDSNPGVRTEAIALLQPVKADSSVREMFTALAQNDKDQYIRKESKRVLATLPDLE